MPDTVKIPTAEYLELLAAKEALTAARAEAVELKEKIRRFEAAQEECK